MKFVFEERPPDSPLIKRIWRTESDFDGTFMSQAGIHSELVVWRYNGETHITVRGPETKATVSDTAAGAEYVGIDLEPGVYLPHLPFNSLVNNALTLPGATGKAFWLNGAVWRLPDFDNADTFIQRLIRDGILVRDTAVAAAIQGQPAHLSPRALQYRFLRVTGMTQETMRQIERAQQATALLESGTSILDTVYATGYFDQAHMTRSLKRFMGQTPAQLAGIKPALLHSP